MKTGGLNHLMMLRLTSENKFEDVKATLNAIANGLTVLSGHGSWYPERL